MKKLIFATLFASTLSFDSKADFVICVHNSGTGNPHYESWHTSFPDGDMDSSWAAEQACMDNGGMAYLGEGDLITYR